MGFIDDVDALKSKGNPSKSYGSSSGICGDKLCSEIEPPQSKKLEHLKMEQDKEMMVKQDKEMMDKAMMMNEYVSLDETIKSEIQIILDQTNYSSGHIMDIVIQLDSYLSTLDKSNLEQKTIKDITDIVFYAQHEQIPAEFAIYEIYEFLK